MLEVLSNCEPEILQVGPEQCHGVDADYQTISILSDLYDRELVGIITWAKQIPGADQTFSPKHLFLIQISAFAKDATHSIYTSLGIHGDANY
jgi:estrogen-related receptor ERR